MHALRFALIISALIAAGAFYPHQSYNYFVLLKWAVTATAVWAAVVEGEGKRTFAVAVFCAVALIHNPFFKFSFPRDTWLVIDGITAGWFLFRAFSSKWSGHDGWTWRRVRRQEGRLVRLVTLLLRKSSETKVPPK